MTHPAFELRSDLRVAARTAQQFGATEDQINNIVALARGSNNYNLLSSGRLTKSDAEHLIRFMIESGAEPEFRQSPEEIAAEREASEQAGRTAAAQKAARSHAKDRKAEKDKIEADKGAALVGKRVHNRFQKIAGTVVSQSGNRVTVQFDGESAPRIVAAAFVTSGDLPA